MRCAHRNPSDNAVHGEREDVVLATKSIIHTIWVLVKGVSCGQIKQGRVDGLGAFKRRFVLVYSFQIEKKNIYYLL